MSRPYQFSEEDKITSPLDRQPAKPLPPTSSFQTNVNRAKTKKWVEAKQYSYEGDDWGDYDEEDEYGVAGSSQPLSVSTAAGKQTGGTRSVTSPLSSTMPSQLPRRPPSFDAGDERRTFSAGFSQPTSVTSSLPQEPPLQLNTGIPQSTGAPTLSSPNMRSPTSAVGSVGPHHPIDQPLDDGAAGPKIIRPADIYKRMAEEREKAALNTPASPDKLTQGVGSVFPATNSTDNAPSVGHAATAETAQREPTGTLPSSVKSSTTQPRVSLPPQLPNVAADSTFGDDFWGPSTAAPKPVANAPVAPQTQLEHTPSVGLRSMVTRAFDEPVSAAGGVRKQDSQRSAAASSVSRTDTGTTDISPIISPISGSSDNGISPIPAITGGAAGPSSAAANRVSDSTIRGPQVPPKDNALETQPESSGFTPGLSSSQQLPRPEVTKLGLATPGQADTGLVLPELTDMSGREADLAAVARGVPEHALPALATSELNAQQSFLERQPSLPANMSPRVQRAESPTKGRVADLTQRFGAGSRRGSDDSLQSWERNSAPPSPTKDAGPSAVVPKSPTKNLAASRPTTERELSFRPKLPGQWESYAGSAASASSEEVAHHEPLGLDTEAAAATPVSKSQQDTDIELTPTTRKHSLPSRDVQLTPQVTASGGAHPVSAMMALTAAGVSMGDAFDKSHGGGTDASSRGPARAYGDIVQRPVTFGRLDSDSDVTTALPTPLPETAIGGTEVDHAAEPTTPKASQVTHQPQTPRNVVAPQLNVEDSPSDLESDRLRKEIVRSLSPTQSPAAGHNDALLAGVTSTAATERPQSSVLPSEYDSYWNDSSPHRDTTQSVSPLVAPISESAAAEQSNFGVVVPPIPTTTNIHSTPAAESSETKKAAQPGPLARRFSWEDETPPANSSAVPLALGASKVAGQTTQSQKALSPHDLAADNPRLSMGGLHVVNAEVDEIPNTPVETPVASREMAPMSIMDSTASVGPSVSQDLPSKPLPVPGAAAASASRGVTGVPPDPKLPSFREIMAMKAPQQRIDTFNATRDAWAKHDSGLNEWVQSTIGANNEHRHLLDGQLFTAPTETFTPRHRTTTSLGNIFTKPTQDSPSQSSYMTASQEKTSPAQQKNPSAGAIKGKELLQSAGVLGGKGLSGAKGLFAKGKQKLKAAGGNDKSTTVEPNEDFTQYRRSTSHSRTSFHSTRNNTPSASLHRASTSTLPIMPSSSSHSSAFFFSSSSSPGGDGGHSLEHAASFPLERAQSRGRRGRSSISIARLSQSLGFSRQGSWQTFSSSSSPTRGKKRHSAVIVPGARGPDGEDVPPLPSDATAAAAAAGLGLGRASMGDAEGFRGTDTRPLSLVAGPDSTSYQNGQGGGVPPVPVPASSTAAAANSGPPPGALGAPMHSPPGPPISSSVAVPAGAGVTGGRPGIAVLARSESVLDDMKRMDSLAGKEGAKLAMLYAKQEDEEREREKKRRSTQRDGLGAVGAVGAIGAAAAGAYAAGSRPSAPSANDSTNTPGQGAEYGRQPGHSAVGGPVGQPIPPTGLAPAIGNKTGHPGVSAPTPDRRATAMPQPEQMGGPVGVPVGVNASAGFSQAPGPSTLPGPSNSNAPGYFDRRSQAAGRMVPNAPMYGTSGLPAEGQGDKQAYNPANFPTAPPAYSREAPDATGRAPMAAPTSHHGAATAPRQTQFGVTSAPVSSELTASVGLDNARKIARSNPDATSAVGSVARQQESAAPALQTVNPVDSPRHGRAPLVSRYAANSDLPAYVTRPPPPPPQATPIVHDAPVAAIQSPIPTSQATSRVQDPIPERTADVSPLAATESPSPVVHAPLPKSHLAASVQDPVIERKMDVSPLPPAGPSPSYPTGALGHKRDVSALKIGEIPMSKGLDTAPVSPIEAEEDNEELIPLPSQQKVDSKLYSADDPLSEGGLGVARDIESRGYAGKPNTMKDMNSLAPAGAATTVLAMMVSSPPGQGPRNDSEMAAGPNRSLYPSSHGKFTGMGKADDTAETKSIDTWEDAMSDVGSEAPKRSVSLTPSQRSVNSQYTREPVTDQVPVVPAIPAGSMTADKPARWSTASSEGVAGRRRTGTFDNDVAEGSRRSSLTRTRMSGKRERPPSVIENYRRRSVQSNGAQSSNTLEEESNDPLRINTRLSGAFEDDPRRSQSRGETSARPTTGSSAHYSAVEEEANFGMRLNVKAHGKMPSYENLAEGRARPPSQASDFSFVRNSSKGKERAVSPIVEPDGTPVSTPTDARPTNNRLEPVISAEATNPAVALTDADSQLHRQISMTEISTPDETKDEGMPSRAPPSVSSIGQSSNSPSSFEDPPRRPRPSVNPLARDNDRSPSGAELGRPMSFVALPRDPNGQPPQEQISIGRRDDTPPVPPVPASAKQEAERGRPVANTAKPLAVVADPSTQSSTPAESLKVPSREDRSSSQKSSLRSSDSASSDAFDPREHGTPYVRMAARLPPALPFETISQPPRPVQDRIVQPVIRGAVREQPTRDRRSSRSPNSFGPPRERRSSSSPHSYGPPRASYAQPRPSRDPNQPMEQPMTPAQPSPLPSSQEPPEPEPQNKKKRSSGGLLAAFKRPASSASSRSATPKDEVAPMRPIPENMQFSRLIRDDEPKKKSIFGRQQTNAAPRTEVSHPEQPRPGPTTLQQMSPTESLAPQPPAESSVPRANQPPMQAPVQPPPQPRMQIAPDHDPSSQQSLQGLTQSSSIHDYAPTSQSGPTGAAPEHSKKKRFSSLGGLLKGRSSHTVNETKRGKHGQQTSGTVIYRVPPNPNAEAWNADLERRSQHAASTPQTPMSAQERPPLPQDPSSNHAFGPPSEGASSKPQSPPAHWPLGQGQQDQAEYFSRQQQGSSWERRSTVHGAPAKSGRQGSEISQVQSPVSAGGRAGSSVSSVSTRRDSSPGKLAQRALSNPGPERPRMGSIAEQHQEKPWQVSMPPAMQEEDRETMVQEIMQAAQARWPNSPSQQNFDQPQHSPARVQQQQQQQQQGFVSPTSPRFPQQQQSQPQPQQRAPASPALPQQLYAVPMSPPAQPSAYPPQKPQQSPRPRPTSGEVSRDPVAAWLPTQAAQQYVQAKFPPPAPYERQQQQRTLHESRSREGWSGLPSPGKSPSAEDSQPVIPQLNQPAIPMMQPVPTRSTRRVRDSQSGREDEDPDHDLYGLTNAPVQRGADPQPGSANGQVMQPTSQPPPIPRRSEERQRRSIDSPRQSRDMTGAAAQARARASARSLTQEEEDWLLAQALQEEEESRNASRHNSRRQGPAARRSVDSQEELVMKATSYPGDEWMPEWVE